MRYITEKLKFSKQSQKEMEINSKKFYAKIKSRRSVRDFKKKTIIMQRDEVDSRLKRILLNENGKKISNEIFFEQKKRIYKALKNSNTESVIKFKEILEKIING